ncbi:hypothetical protein WK58_09315 [Burkholderia ubonensis]|nr:hypothetical protein WK58_09315 [Burkholderia ubonensis]
MEEALREIDRVIRLAPKMAEAYDARGNMLLAIANPDRALRSFDEAITLKPMYAPAWVNRANALLALGQPEAALESVEHAVIGGASIHPPAWNTYGGVLLALDRPADALACFDRAIATDPTFAQAWMSRGAAWLALNEPTKAIDDFRHADELASGLDTAEVVRNAGPAQRDERNLALLRFNESFAHLVQGDFTTGWKYFESRWNIGDGPFVSRGFGAPHWRGESLVGKTILLHAEQGLGDTIQFVRYVPRLAAHGANVILEVQPPLETLFSQFNSVARVVRRGEPLPEFDCFCPLMSLPGILGETVETLDASPYLRPIDARRAEWQARLNSDGMKKKVGLVWSGSTVHQNDRKRSIPLATFQDILPTDMVGHCLQKELREADREILDRLPIRYWGDQIGDFADTAEILSMLDLVITVDTSVAHLAGAMGKRVWVLVAFSPDWRWMLDRHDSPWYRGVRIFRQPAPGAWGPVLKEVRQTLEHFLSGEMD